MIAKIRKLRPTMTIPQLAEVLNMRVRKLENLLSKYKIRKYKKVDYIK